MQLAKFTVTIAVLAALCVAPARAADSTLPVCTTDELATVKKVQASNEVTSVCTALVMNGETPDYTNTEFCKSKDCIATIKKTKKAMPKCSYNGKNVRKGMNKLLKACTSAGYDTDSVKAAKSSSGDDDDNDDDASSSASSTPSPTKTPKTTKTPKPTTTAPATTAPPIGTIIGTNETVAPATETPAPSDKPIGSPIGSGTEDVTVSTPAPTTKAPTVSTTATSGTVTVAASTCAIVLTTALLAVFV